MMFAGVDKVGLHTQAYKVKSLDGWCEKSGRKVGEQPPVFLCDGDGHPVPGAGFFLNAGKVIFDLSPKGLLVSFNPSKIRHPYHLLTDPKEVGKIGDDVQRTLLANGVLVNLNNMQTVRMDLAKQQQLTHPLNRYGDALSHLKGKRMTGHAYPDGYAFRNTQRESMFYNKTRELHEQQKMGIPESRLGRMEGRWKKGRPLAKDFGFSGFGDLRRADPAHLTSVYRDALHRDVFRTDHKAVQMILNYDTEVNVLRSYLDAGRNGVMKYLMDMHTGPHVAALGGWDVFAQMLRDAGMKERTIRHNVLQLRLQTQRAALVNAGRDKQAVNMHTLLDELKTAFAA